MIFIMKERISFIFQPKRIFVLQISIGQLIPLTFRHRWFFDKCIPSCHILMYSLSKINLLSGCFSNRNLLKLNSFFNILSDFIIFLNIFLTKHCILCVLNHNKTVFLVLLCYFFYYLALVFLFDLV